MSKPDELVMMEVKCFLTEEEKIERGSELARHVQNAEMLTNEKKERAAAYKTKIDTHRLEAVALSDALQAGYEHRQIECRKVIHYALRTVDFVRNDTGELVQTRPMEIGEAQENMFDETPNSDERHKGKITLLGR
ncbi:MAG: hypothetical protein HKK66_02975 [Chlorobiaceae bacterium]|nr:hypothetical protein [Chlorobiaceae bacterium]